MLLLRIILLWSALSLHVVGAATLFHRLFHRLFPRESPWLGFFVPSLGLVLILNFIEHCVALPSLLWLLPITTIACIWGICGPRAQWKGLVLPAAIFLAAFAFTLGLRCLKPDIPASRDGITDLSLVANYCQGQILPPVCTWFPPYPITHYYALLHYAASIVVRLLDVDIGTGFNLTSALLAAFIALAATAVAWRISRQKVWITVLAPILIECAATGSSACLWLTSKNLNANGTSILFLGMDNPDDHNPLWKFLEPTDPINRRELMVPGAWSWIGALHSTCGGQFLLLFPSCLCWKSSAAKLPTGPGFVWPSFLR